MKICPKCGYENPSDSSFCEKCGTAVSEQGTKDETKAKYCWKCGTPLYGEDEFCVKCGTKQKREPVNGCASSQSTVSACSEEINSGNEKSEGGKKNKLMVLFAVLAVLAVAIVGGILVFNHKAVSLKTEDRELVTDPSRNVIALNQAIQEGQKVFDGAELFISSEKDDLEKKLDEVYAESGINFYVVTVTGYPDEDSFFTLLNSFRDHANLREPYILYFINRDDTSGKACLTTSKVNVNGQDLPKMNDNLNTYSQNYYDFFEDVIEKVISGASISDVSISERTQIQTQVKTQAQTQPQTPAVENVAVEETATLKMNVGTMSFNDDEQPYEFAGCDEGDGILRDARLENFERIEKIIVDEYNSMSAIDITGQNGSIYTLSEGIGILGPKTMNVGTEKMNAMSYRLPVSAREDIFFHVFDNGWLFKIVSGGKQYYYVKPEYMDQFKSYFKTVEMTQSETDIRMSDGAKEAYSRLIEDAKINGADVYGIRIVPEYYAFLKLKEFENPVLLMGIGLGPDAFANFYSYENGTVNDIYVDQESVNGVTYGTDEEGNLYQIFQRDFFLISHMDWDGTGYWFGAGVTNESDSNKYPKPKDFGITPAQQYSIND